MRQSLGAAPVILALMACVSLGCVVVCDSGERPIDEITLEREKIFVNFENGSTFSVMVEPNETVRHLWDHIYDYEAVPHYLLWLKLGDTQLDNKAKLLDYNIRAGSTVTLVKRQPSNPNITFKVRTRDGRDLKVTTQVDNTVATLKENIKLLTGVPKEEQRLVLLSKQLKDDRKLSNYCFKEHTIVHLARPLEDCRRDVTISIKTLSDATIKVAANMADTVDGLKERIWKITGVPVGVQRLFDKTSHVISGDDHLCDIELLPGPLVHMYLYSSQITSLDQIARLKVVLPEVHSIDPDKGPIFRERTTSRAAHLFKQASNWIPSNGRFSLRCNDLFDPNAYMTPSPDHDDIDRAQNTLRTILSPDYRYDYPWDTVILRTGIMLSLALEPYWDAANLTLLDDASRKYRAITLGGGFYDLSPGKVTVPLGADLNNWAPEGFNDSDLMSLFELAERVRQVLARSEQTDEPILSIPRQRRINQAILYSYILALAGGYPACDIEYNQERESSEQCTICMDELTAGRAIRLTCGHVFRDDCILSLVGDLFEQDFHNFQSRCDEKLRCPNCSERFMLPYAYLAEAELTTP